MCWVGRGEVWWLCIAEVVTVDIDVGYLYLQINREKREREGGRGGRE